MRNIKPYNWYNNPPDPASPDAQQVVEWLRGKRVPALPVPEVKKGTPAFLNNYATPIYLVWKDGAEVLLEQGLDLVLNSPAVALTELKRAYGFGNPFQFEPYPEQQ